MNKKKIFKVVFVILFVAFIISYAIEKTGYYEYNLQNKKNLTEDQIKQFELDVKEGKDIDLDRYLKDTQVDYSNKLTQTTSQASIKLNDYLNNFLSNTFKILEKFVK